MSHRSVMDAPLRSATPFAEETADPMAGLANIADVMLVFACGLMVALVVYWNLDMTPEMTEVVESEELSELNEDVEEGELTMTQNGAGFEELGVVYRDPETGKMYMLSNDES